MRVETRPEIERACGPTAPPYPDFATADLARSVRWWIRSDKMQRGMQAAHQPAARIEAMQKVWRAYERDVQKALKSHPLWPWLSDKPGLRGPYVAWIIARIRDPRRFPGQMCFAGHYLPAIYEEGHPCTANVAALGKSPEPCGEVLSAPRPHTGVRSLWHYFGLHVVDGRRARKSKGKKATWVTDACGILLGPTGIASQIERHGPEPYRGIYDQQKERIAVARGGAEPHPEIDMGCAPPANSNGAGAGYRRVAEGSCGLRPFEIRTRARTIAVKAFLGDLMIEWKRVLAAQDGGGGP